ncbi:MAG: terminase large subunit, partial [Caulobacteraceae bacterium]
GQLMHSTACVDWQARIAERRSLIPAPIFVDEAEEALKVFKSLRIVDVQGKPTFGEACEEWVFDFVRAVFGAYDAATGRRLIREFFLLISKKNMKSTLAAGIMITALIRNWRHSGELLILAPTKEVADNAFGPAKDMVAEDEELRALLHVQEHIRTVTHRITKAVLKVVAADSDVVSGKKAAFVLIDELWIFGKRAAADAMLREATGGLVARPEGFVIYLSTQSDEPPAGVFRAKLQYFRSVRDGKVDDPRSLPVLFEFPEHMLKSGAHLRPENFYITNPNLGRSVDIDWLIDELRKLPPSGNGRQVFLAKHLNVEPGMASRSDSWAGAEFWKRRADKQIALADIIARCEVIVVGLDGGGLDDLYGMTVLGRETTEIEVAAAAAPEEAQEAVNGRKRIKRWLSWSHAWAHRIVLDRRQIIESKLLDFEAAGDLTILDDGAMINGWPADIAEMVSIVRQIRDAGLLCCVAADPAGLGEMIDALDEINVTTDNRESGFDYVIGAPQGYAMMNALKTAERKLANGTLLHADQPMMDWCVANLKIEATATAIRATKQNAGDAKIDPAMALFDAVTVMATNPEARRSVYEDRGLLVL